MPPSTRVKHHHAHISDNEERSCSAGNSSVTTACPIPCSNTNRMAPLSTVLSRGISSTKSSVLIEAGGDCGKPAALSKLANGASVSAANQPSATEKRAAIIMPAPTASPCNQLL